MKRIALALVATLAAAAPASAQHQGHGQAAAAAPAMCVLGGGHGGEHGQQQGGGHEMTLWAHEFMMYSHHAKDFELTADQTARIERIREAAQASCAQHMTMAMAAHDAATAAFGRAAPDMATFEAKAKEAAQHHGMAQIAVARAALEAFALLTPTQREKAVAERTEHAAQAAGGHSGH